MENIADKEKQARISSMSRFYPCGNLEVVTGPMLSAKTSWLNAQLTALADMDEDGTLRILRIGFVDDKVADRGTNGVDGCNSHSSSFFGLSKKIVCRNVSRLLEVTDVRNWDVIGIDEAHFYPDLITFIELCLSLGKIIRVAGLDGDSGMGKFGQVSKLVRIADKFEKLLAKCYKCLREGSQTDAPFTIRLTDDKTQVHIGGAKDYRPACRKHWMEHQRNVRTPSPPMMKLPTEGKAEDGLVRRGTITHIPSSSVDSSVLYNQLSQWNNTPVLSPGMFTEQEVIQWVEETRRLPSGADEHSGMLNPRTQKTLEREIFAEAIREYGKVVTSSTPVKV